MTTLFEKNDDLQEQSSQKATPFADVMRPTRLDDLVGQDHITSQGSVFSRMVEADLPGSVIFWGPPGCGKTTIARILAHKVDAQFEQISAIFSGTADLKKIFESARIRRQNGRRTILFVDEIHHFNKSQQDAFLPVMENGTITLIGATTENPSFALNDALLSRTQIIILNRLEDDALEKLLQRAEKHKGKTLPLDEDARATLITMADGDGRYLLGAAEQVFAQTNIMSRADLLSYLQKRAPLYDKKSEGHYNLISALHKAVRGSDPDAALYWLARMLEGGEDRRFLARRIVRMAVEDIGLADPAALQHTLAAWENYERLGSPEGDLGLAQAVLYVATAPKSNAVYTAFKKALRAAQESGSKAPPAHILNAPTPLMKDIGYGAGYEYDHDAPDGFSGQNYFPDDMDRIEFYRPPERGFEREINKRLTYWKNLRNKKSQKKAS